MDFLLDRPDFAQVAQNLVRDAVVALAVAVLEVGGTGAVVESALDRVREEGLQDCGEETYYS